MGKNSGPVLLQNKGSLKEGANTYASIMQYLFHTYEKYRRALNVSCVRFITVLDFFISLFKVTVIGLLIIKIFVVWL